MLHVIVAKNPYLHMEKKIDLQLGKLLLEHQWLKKKAKMNIYLENHNETSKPLQIY